MDQRYDVIGMGLMVFSTIVVIAITMDPKGFSIQAWQPLMASVLALGGAGIVYRAAMAKVEHEKDIDQREVRKRLRGAYLRLSYASYILGDEASRLLAEISYLPWNLKSAILGTAPIFRSEVDIVLAWNEIESFDEETAVLILSTRMDLYNVENARKFIHENGNSVSDDTQPSINSITTQLESLKENASKLAARAYEQAEGVHG